MRWGPALVLSLALTAGTQAQPALPGKTIAVDERDPCEQYGFLEGKDCGALAEANEPLLPVTRKDVKLAFRLNWGRGGERNFQSIVMRVELQSPSRGFVDFVQFRNGSPAWGGEALTTNEIATLLRVADTSGFWTLPLTDRTPKRDPTTGAELLIMCRGTFALSGMEADRRRVLRRDCPTVETDPALLEFAHTLIRIGRRHREWLAADKDFWPDMQ